MINLKVDFFPLPLMAHLVSGAELGTEPGTVATRAAWDSDVREPGSLLQALALPPSVDLRMFPSWVTTILTWPTLLC